MGEELLPEGEEVKRYCVYCGRDGVTHTSICPPVMEEDK